MIEVHAIVCMANQIIKTPPSNDVSPNNLSQVPLIYLFSSTLNDCSFMVLEYFEYCENGNLLNHIESYVVYIPSAGAGTAPSGKRKCNFLEYH